MNLIIHTRPLESEPSFLAIVDWTQYMGDGKVPRNIIYNDNEEKAYNELRNILENQGHTVINKFKKYTNGK